MTREQLALRLRHRVARDPEARLLRDSSIELGADLWLVGGYVRDAALGLRSDDLDLAAGPGVRRLLARLRESWATRGFRFRRRGVTTWRLATDSRRIDIVDASRRGLEEDLRRRELTINAVAYDLRRAVVLDPLGGLADLRKGLLRLPRKGIVEEDPARALRMARFLAQLPGFRLHRNARRAAAAAAPRLRRVAVERTREELDKLLGASAPRRGLDALARLGLLASVLPELEPLQNCRAGRDRPDVWTHTLETIAVSERSGRLPAGFVIRSPASRRILRWTLLLHDISKPETLATAEDGRPTFHGHEMLGARRADALLARLRLPKGDRRRIGRLIEQHLRPSLLAEAGAPTRGMRRLVRDAGDDLPILVQHAACDALGSGAPDATRRWRRLSRMLRRLLSLWEARQREPLPQLITGTDLIRSLGLEQGPAIGRLLRAVREAQDEGQVRTPDEALRFARRRNRQA